MSKVVPDSQDRYQPTSAEQPDPDCLKCLRSKLKADGVVVFFAPDAQQQEWRIGNFQGLRPRSAAEVDFEIMLANRVPEIVTSNPEGVLVCDDLTLESLFPAMAYLWKGKSLVAARVTRLRGVRLAWRDDETEPFTADDLKTLECFGQCPRDCTCEPRIRIQD
jgi:hypothetical protein